ncbi:hypothetical protein OsJ_36769 [Oryza sativa Japonica Group]|uniref:Uncharacterized protein n=1 Tax=Oryza sativa subsp. japonica TaxID=39947 RepID=A3CJ63_ORYSJ|nr:hypothetical protein OsJ_36769 [Oryza sativa Japonica Group]
MGSKPHGLTHEISWVIMGRPTVTHGALWADPLARFQVEYQAGRTSCAAASLLTLRRRRIALWSSAPLPLPSTMEERDAHPQDRRLDAPFLLPAAPCAPPRSPRSCHQQTSQPAIEEGDGSYGRMLQLSAPHPPSLSPRRRQRWTSTCVDAAGLGGDPLKAEGEHGGGGGGLDLEVVVLAEDVLCYGLDVFGAVFGLGDGFLGLAVEGRSSSRLAARSCRRYACAWGWGFEGDGDFWEEEEEVEGGGGRGTKGPLRRVVAAGFSSLVHSLGGRTEVGGCR